MKNINDILEPPAHSTGQEIARTATQSLESVRSTVTEQAGRAFADVKTATDQQLERQKKELVGSLRSVDLALRQTATKMDNPVLAPQVKRAADALSQAGDYLESHHVEDVARSLRSLSLRHPAIFYSGVFALGFAAGRFLSSSQHRSVEPTHLQIAPLAEPPPELKVVSVARGDASLVPEAPVVEESLRLQPEVF